MKTHKQHFLHAHNLPDGAYSLKQLAKISYVPMSILQEVYNRGIGAYKTQPSSVRLKGSYVKGVKAPMSAKLSKEQWGMARVYSFLDGNPKHDNDLRANKRGGGPSQSIPPTPEAKIDTLLDLITIELDNRNTDPITGRWNRAEEDRLGRDLLALVTEYQSELSDKLITKYNNVLNRSRLFREAEMLLFNFYTAINEGNVDIAQTLRDRFRIIEANARLTPRFHTIYEENDRRFREMKRNLEYPTEPIPDQPSCMICGDDFEPGETIRVLSCGHKFHRKCWNDWVIAKDPQNGLKATCPICRQPSGLGKPKKCRKCGGVKR